ncbi:MAG TPA: alkaline phosphatase family protein [Candidatus Elarobacter sp.]|jgi:acid phosphatase
MKVPVRRLVVAAVVVLIAAAGAGWWYFSSGHTRIVELPETAQRAVVAAVPGFTMPHPKHILVIVEENKSYDDIIGDTKDAPYLNGLAAQGALFTQSFGIAHPSQPNYFALYAGVTTRVGDACNVTDIPADAPNLGADLLAAHHTFVAYAESLPQPGFRGCSAGQYARKHAPWTHFTNVPDSAIQPFTAFPAHDPARLPDVAFVIPNELDDMHSASIARGDAWLKTNLGPLIARAAEDDLVVVITWDESSEALSNHIPTIFTGARVKRGRFGETITHYDVLRTIEDLERIGHDGHAATALPIVDVWR